MSACREHPSASLLAARPAAARPVVWSLVVGAREMAAGTTAVTAVVVLSVWDLGAAAGAGPSKEASPNPDRCGLQFREAAAEALAASQAPPDCATGRLLVFGTEKDSFEGVGSLLIGFAEGLAEAHHSGRSFLFGPQAAHPPVLRSARCPGQGGNRLLWGFDCYFQPLGTCRWEEHVHREEAIAFASGGSWRPESRVAMSHPRRGGPALYTPPPELAAKLPKDLDHAGRAECWAGAVVSYVLRPKGDNQRTSRHSYPCLALPMPRSQPHPSIPTRK